MRYPSPTWAKSFAANCATRSVLKTRISFRKVLSSTQDATVCFQHARRTNHSCKKGPTGMIDERYLIASIEQFVGRELGVSEWIVVTQDMINNFAETTGDRQWIHVDVERARRESPFGGPIAHGYLTLSLVAAMVMELGVIPPDAATGLNYGLDKVRFIAPIKAGARVRT